MLLYGILTAFSILVLTVNTQPAIACSGLIMEVLEQHVGCVQGWWLCICICICIYVCVNVCIYVCVYVCVSIYVYVCVYIYECVYVCMHIFIYVCMCVCIYVIYRYRYQLFVFMVGFGRDWHLVPVLLLLTLGN